MEKPGASLFAPENRQHLEASFKAFLARPENWPLVEAHQGKEVKRALRLQEQVQDAQLRAQVLALSADDQRRVQPLLKVPALRRLLQTLATAGHHSRAAAGPASAPPPAAATGDRSQHALGAAVLQGPGEGHRQQAGLAAWVSNPRVMHMFEEAAAMVRQGALGERQLEELLVKLLGTGQGQDHQCQRQRRKGGAKQQQQQQLPATAVVLPSAMLVEALNEHLAERRAGGQAYRQQQYEAALRHYTRAAAITAFVRGANRDDQAEVNHNHAQAHLHMAAAHMGLQQWGDAVAACDAALSIAGPLDGIDRGTGGGAGGWEAGLRATALLRRCHANLARHEHGAAEADVAALEATDPWCEELAALRGRVRGGRRAGAGERRMCAKMLAGLSQGA